MPSSRRLFAVVFATLCGLVTAPASAQQKSVTIFAPVSLKTALDDVAVGFSNSTGVQAVFNYAATGIIARQLEQGASADVFISADPGWMDWVAERKLIDVTTRANLLGNTLVIAVPASSNLAARSIAKGFDVTVLANNGRIAIGDPKTVPLGAYTYKALEWCGPTKSQPNFAFADSARSVLVLVARGEAPIGIVYGTDVKADPKVKVLAVFPDESHPPILYAVAATTSARDEAAVFLDYLASSAAKAVFERAGFSYLLVPKS